MKKTQEVNMTFINNLAIQVIIIDVAEVTSTAGCIEINIHLSNERTCCFLKSSAVAAFIGIASSTPHFYHLVRHL